MDGPGSSGNAGTGSHLAGADFSDEPGDVLWRWSTPRRTESGLLLYGTSPQDSAVQKTALWCTQPSLWRRKICPVRITEKKGRSGSPHQRTARGRDFTPAKSESDSRRGRTSGAAERQRDVTDIDAAETPGEGLPSRLAPESGCHEVTGLRWRACAASAGVRGYARHKDTAE